MSIAVLNQVYDEARRLAVAGSVVARGDFRLKKLLPPLEQAGAKAPVFAKVTEAAKAVIDGPEDSSAESLLELTALASAVLYTQGETGIEGELKPIEMIDLGGQLAQTSARLLKPLLEALSSTGSGRLELVKEAHERGAFRDLRLVKPALDGLDDPYQEVADFLAEKVVPMYGSAVLSELRAKYDPKSTKGHPRRLRLMHALDPAAARDLVKQALEGGSKEVKVAAIACLGAEKEDLAILIEHAGAKAKEVRLAAYHALAVLDDSAAVAVLEKALAGKDLDLVTSAIHRSKSEKLTAVLLVEIGKAWADLPKIKDKKQVSEKSMRLVRLLGSLPEGEHRAADALTLDLFARRAELAKVKGAHFSGSDVVEAVIGRMADGSKQLRTTLARAHAELDAEHLSPAVRAGRAALPPAEMYDLFSPYVLAAAGKKAGKKDNAAAKQAAVRDGLDAVTTRDYWHSDDGEEKLPPLDPRWLDVGIQTENLRLVQAAGRPGHPGATAFLTKLFDVEFKKKTSNVSSGIVLAMARLQHPGAADALLAAYEKFVVKAKGYIYDYWYYRVIPELSKAAIPALEAFLPKLKDRAADQWIDAIQELRNK